MLRQECQKHCRPAFQGRPDQEIISTKNNNPPYFYLLEIGYNNSILTEYSFPLTPNMIKMGQPKASFSCFPLFAGEIHVVLIPRSTLVTPSLFQGPLYDPLKEGMFCRNFHASKMILNYLLATIEASYSEPQGGKEGYRGNDLMLGNDIL